MRTIAFYNLKGGVGKTASAVNIAYMAARAGLRTLLWDLDPQGSASWYLAPDKAGVAGVKKILKGRIPVGELVLSTDYPQLDLIPAEFSFRNAEVALERWGEDETVLRNLIAPFGELYSLVVLDCPPSLSHMAEQVFRASDAVFMPLIPTQLSLRTFAQVRQHMKHKGLGHKHLYPFFTMVDRRRKLHSELVADPPDALKRLLRASIPYSSMVEKMGEHGAPLPVYGGQDAAVQSYEALWTEIADVARLG